QHEYRRHHVTDSTTLTEPSHGPDHLARYLQRIAVEHPCACDRWPLHPSPDALVGHRCAIGHPLPCARHLPHPRTGRTSPFREALITSAPWTAHPTPGSHVTPECH